MRNFCFLLIALLVLSMQYCAPAPEKTRYYTVDDYSKVPKIDVHTHINNKEGYFADISRKDNFRLVDITLESPGNPTVHEQQAFAIYQMNTFPKQIIYCAAIETKEWDSADWQAKTIAFLDSCFKNGATAVKVWKNIGMDLKDKDGKFVMIDNPRFDTIIDFIEKNNATLIGHLGEPKNCWLPLDQMTVKNDREYFKNHPQYHMFLHPEFPSYEDQINARDHMLEKHPNIRFSGAHLASLEWSLEELSKRLDKFPNMAVDMAERISHLQYLTKNDFQKVYDFFIKYQDRLEYATDLEVGVEDDSTAEVKRIHDTRFAHWKYFVTDDTITAPEIEGSFKALHLPADVVDKIYSKNAEKWFPAFTKQ
ncbi:MAG: amidohydrolase family protein [Flavitalea sp.]